MSLKENTEIAKKWFDEKDWHYQMSEHDALTVFESGVNTDDKCVFNGGITRCV